MHVQKCLHKILLKRSLKARKNSFTSNFQPQIDNLQVGHTQINQNKQTRHQTLWIIYKQKKFTKNLRTKMNIKKQKHINKKQKKQTLKAKNTETILD
jgi:hypothetical protein